MGHFGCLSNTSRAQQPPRDKPADLGSSLTFTAGGQVGRRKGAGMSHTWKESGVSPRSLKLGVLPCHPPPSHVGEHRMLRDAQYTPSSAPARF